jgi:hypothetical protein
LSYPSIPSCSIRTFDPLAFITQSRCLPFFFDAKAIYLPSGDQEGDSFLLLSVVSWTTLPPSSSMARIWKDQPTIPSKAIRFPFGDQEGDVL